MRAEISLDDSGFAAHLLGRSVGDKPALIENTVQQVLGGAVQPQVPMAPAPVRTGNLLVNPSYETAGANGLPSSCWSNISNGPSSPPSISRTSDAHEGSYGLAISVPSSYDSWAYNFIAPMLDLAQCSPTAVPGHRYTFTGWFKSDAQIKVVAFWRNAGNHWERIGWGSAGTATFTASAAWKKATFTFQAPAGATAVSAGFYVDGSVVNPGGNSFTIDDTSLVDDDAVPGSNHALTVAKAGTGSGTVTSDPAGISCGATCVVDLTDGTPVTLTAVATAGSSFTGWTGACSGSSTCAVTMSAARSVTATFTLLPMQLTVAKAGTGSGSVTSNPAGISCGVTCGADFTNGASVTLTAVAAAGSSFSGWTGACSGSAATCTVTMSAARSVTATFTLLPMQLMVAKTGNGSGAVTSDPAGHRLRRDLCGRLHERRNGHAHGRCCAGLDVHGLERRLHRRRGDLHRDDERCAHRDRDVHDQSRAHRFASPARAPGA